MRVRIKEIAEETALSSKEVLEKARELGFNVKAANSSLSLEEAEILNRYIIEGTIPPSLQKKESQSDIDKEDKSKELQDSKKVEEAKEQKSETEVVKEEKKEPQKEEKEKEPPKRATESKKTRAKEPTEIRRRPRKRGGITIIKKAKKEEAPKTQEIKKEEVKEVKKEPLTIKEEKIKKETKESSPSKKEIKKEKKKAAPKAKVSGEKIDIGDRELGNSREIYEEEEVVLLDLSDKILLEEQEKEEQRRAEEEKRKAKSNVVRNSRIQAFQNQPTRSKKKKKKKKAKQEELKKISIPEEIRVYEFAQKIGKSESEVIETLENLGVTLSKNDFLDKDSIEILAEEYGVEVEVVNPWEELDYVAKYDAIPNQKEVERPPVITVMGHVDHGKTSLLDKIRETKVAQKEAGGITQHVGAYQVEKDGKKITFIDTPGHSAFTQMRARGAQATDIAIIVVAADDGVMPQTKESISHAKAANVPMIFAINKIDKPTANPDNVKSQLAEMGIVPVEWGGDYEFVHVSAHTGEGIDDLLDTILLQAEMMELKADPTRKAKAIVLESSLEKGLGPVANIIVKNGTLKVGDSVIVGTTYGRVRGIILDNGKRAKEAPPSTPAAVIGLHEVPQAGDIMVAMDSEKEAKELAHKIKEYKRSKELSKTTKISIDELSALIAQGKIKKLPVIIKADVQGSLEAIKKALGELKNDEVEVDIIHEGVGAISESDVLLADASDHAIILGFNVRPTGAVKNKAKELGIEIKTYSIIYDLIDDVKALLSGLMSPIIKEEVIGQAEVRQTFHIAKVGTVAGCFVIDGVIQKDAKARLIRNGVVIYTTNIASLKRFSDDVKEVKKGYECGIMLENFNDIKEGDIIEAFIEKEEKASL